MEVKLFHSQRKNSPPTATKAIKDLVAHVPAPQFLAQEKRQGLLEKIKNLIALENSRYEGLCYVLIENLVHYCQSLPETTNSYYSQAGGLVDHALNRTEAALSLFQKFMVQDQVELSEEQLQWQYALFSAAILQGIGKLYVDYRIHLFDSHGKLLQPWNPLLENLVQTGSYYQYEFKNESELEFRRRLNLLMARTLMPASGFAWIASNPQVLAVWLALLNEDPRSAGTLGAILICADALAIQRYFLEFLGKNLSNRSGRFRAATFSGPPEILLEKEQLMGVEFIQWMMQALEKGALIINKAPLFMVPAGLVMCQEIFQLFVREHPEYKNWQAVKKGFLSLGLHRCNADGSLMTRFEQLDKKQMLSGIVFSEYMVAISGSVKVMQGNTKKVCTFSSMELVHEAQFSNQLIQQQNLKTILPLQKLSTTGQWQNLENDKSLIPGAKRGG